MNGHFILKRDYPQVSAAFNGYARSFFFHGRRHPGEMGGPEVEAYLSWLANERNVAVSTHRQGLSSLLFLYQKVLGLSLLWMEAIGRPHRELRLPVVLSVDEVTRILALLQGEHRLFEQRTIVIRTGKGGKDRSVMLPLTLAPALREQLARARVLWSADGEAGRSGVSMPGALDRKYPRAGAPSNTYRAGTPGTFRREHDHDLYPRAQGRRRWRAQPGGFTAADALIPPMAIYFRRHERETQSLRDGPWQEPGQPRAADAAGFH